ncbi:phosphatase PAP2 family protein [Halovivax gelatinilyticus]|uniref:phosphatase PAP2 family protein n=1 Tax=Halovivax gelatinilyticus TaxID=2961597 RepID=UPI0020CA9144|nr:phosphatase PAP2 family protein [Halovivax gelatinilyticus]
MLLPVLVQLVAVLAAMIAIAAAVFFDRRRLVQTRAELPARLRVVAPVTVVLIAVLLLNSIIRQYIPDISWIIGWELTWTFYQLEGDFIGWIQSFQTPIATAFFSFVYVYGYAFLLVFPVIAYLFLSDTRPLRLLLTAYTLNYTIGPLLYVFFIVYGPRNFAAEGLLYDVYPRYQHLTGEINRNTNVFPSLHVSLAVTVAAIAYSTRDTYRGWYYLAAFGALSVSVSTMYLGIHWAIDVVGGLGLAAVSVYLAHLFVGRWSVTERIWVLYRRFVEPTIR